MYASARARELKLDTRLPEREKGSAPESVVVKERKLLASAVLCFDCVQGNNKRNRTGFVFFSV